MSSYQYSWVLFILISTADISSGTNTEVKILFEQLVLFPSADRCLWDWLHILAVFTLNHVQPVQLCFPLMCVQYLFWVTQTLLVDRPNSLLVLVFFIRFAENKKNAHRKWTTKHFPWSTWSVIAQLCSHVSSRAAWWAEHGICTS